MSIIFTVQELTDHIEKSLEKTFPFVWVKGEVSNLARPSSGHVYFSLKDKDALLNCVCFKHAQRPYEKFDPLTGEVFEGGPRQSLINTIVNGQEILCAGHLSVYHARGVYQLNVTLVQESGYGSLYLTFENLKNKLLLAGYFKDEYKKKIPFNPNKVALLTSSKGAAIHDFLHIAQLGGICSKIRIFPVPVQGKEASICIARTINEVSNLGWADVIVLIRGGGSIEDLWAFNEEIVADAIFQASTPILTGIGHEVDTSIADLVADMRVATPTHAAQILWQKRSDLIQILDNLEILLHNVEQNILEKLEKIRFSNENALKWLSPIRVWQRKEEQLVYLVYHLKKSLRYQWAQKGFYLNFIYSLFPKLENNLESLEKTLHSLSLSLIIAMQKNFRQKDMLFNNLEDILFEKIYRFDIEYFDILTTSSFKLESLNPLAPLKRGYALVEDVDGNMVCSINNIEIGQHIKLSLADGHVVATVSKRQSILR